MTTAKAPRVGEGKPAGTGDAILPATRVCFAQAAVEPSAAQWVLLSPAERTLVAAKRNAVDRDRSATARVLLKLLLAQEFGVDPLSVSLLPLAGEGGKPVLHHAPVPGLVTPLQANVAHAGGQVLVAVAQGGHVGVDVEEHRATGFAGFDTIALSAQERLLVASLPDHVRARQRADFWVRKEAVLKALGVGLLRDPAQLNFATAGACSATEISGHPPVAVHLIQTPLGYSAALAVRGAAAVVCHESSFSATRINNYATKTWSIRK